MGVNVFYSRIHVPVSDDGDSDKQHGTKGVR